MITSLPESPVAQIYLAPHLSIAKATSSCDFAGELMSLARDKTVKSILGPFTHKLAPAEVVGSPMDEKGPVAEIFRPRELSMFLAELREKAKVHFLWVGQTANQTARGQYDAKTQPFIGDLDFTVISATDTPVDSAQTLFERLSGCVNLKRINRAQNRNSNIVAEFGFGGVNNPYRLVFLTGKNNPDSGVATARLILRRNSREISWMTMDEESIADLGYAAKNFDHNRLKEMAGFFPREDSLGILVDPTPDGEFPFNLWLIDPQMAADASLQTDTITYPPTSTIFFVDEAKGFRGVLYTQESLVRGLRVAMRWHKKVPEQVFEIAGKEVAENARKYRLLTHEDRIKVSSKLQQINWKLETMIREFPDPTVRLLCGALAAHIFPRVGQVLSSETNRGRRLRQSLLDSGASRISRYNPGELCLADVITFFTLEAGQQKLPVWSDRRNEGRINRSQRARNTFSPLFPTENLTDEPYGAETYTFSLRLVDHPLQAALKILEYQQA